jgi:hypothetical protein
MALPARKGRHQPDPQRVWVRSEAGQRIQIGPSAVGREACEINRVPDWMNRDRVTTHLPHVFGHAARVGDDGGTAMRKTPQ